jgi:hypothetical protein
MSTVLDYIQCPQCGFQRADTEYNCRTNEHMLLKNTFTQGMNFKQSTA